MLAGLGLVDRSRPAVDAQQRAGVVSFVLATLYAVFLAWAERTWPIIPNVTILEVVGGTLIIFAGALLSLNVYKRWVNVDLAEFIGTHQASPRSSAPSSSRRPGLACPSRSGRRSRSRFAS